MSDIKAIDVTDPDELASELDQLSHTYAVRTGDYSMSANLSAAADWLRFQSERIAELEAKQSQWRSVDDEPTDADMPIIVYTPIESIDFRIARDVRLFKAAMSEATHWCRAPIPPLPEGG